MFSGCVGKQKCCQLSFCPSSVASSHRQHTRPLLSIWPGGQHSSVICFLSIVASLGEVALVSQSIFQCASTCSLPPRLLLHSASLRRHSLWLCLGCVTGTPETRQPAGRSERFLALMRPECAWSMSTVGLTAQEISFPVENPFLRGSYCHSMAGSKPSWSYRHELDK